MSRRSDREADGREYVAWKVGGWSVYAGQVAPGSIRWSVYVLPEGASGDPRRMKRICHGMAETRANAEKVAECIATALDHILTENAGLAVHSDGPEA